MLVLGKKALLQNKQTFGSSKSSLSFKSIGVINIDETNILSNNFHCHYYYEKDAGFGVSQFDYYYRCLIVRIYYRATPPLVHVEYIYAEY